MTEPPSPDTDPPIGDDPEPEPEPDPEPDTFPRSYVEELREEARGYRQRISTEENRVAELSEHLWRNHVAATGRLADPDDLPWPTDTDPSDTDQIHEKIDALLSRKPHLAARRANGDIGQHDRAETAPVNLAAMLRANT